MKKISEYGLVKGFNTALCHAILLCGTIAFSQSLNSSKPSDRAVNSDLDRPMQQKGEMASSTAIRKDSAETSETTPSQSSKSPGWRSAQTTTCSPTDLDCIETRLPTCAASDTQCTQYQFPACAPTDTECLQSQSPRNRPIRSR